MNKRLLEWYDASARTLPWRGTAEPYRIWLSEIMLQQTRADTVAPYYLRFLSAFPNVHALAEASEDEVLKLWEGLGYYSRARNLHATAKRIASSGGDFPVTLDDLLDLPGVGAYTARAIASIAYQDAVPALDGNQMRVLSRIFAVERVLNTPFDLEELAMQVISRDRPGDYNQALMDLGASICTTKRPSCARCPLQTLCMAHASGDEERYPLRPAPIIKREEARTVLLIEVNGGICVRRRKERLLGGLYEFPSLEEHLSPAELQVLLSEQGYSHARDFELLPAAKHVFTHLIWRMKGYFLRADSQSEETMIVNSEQLRALAMPGALRVYRELAQNYLDLHKD